MYDYNTEKPKLFTDEGQRVFLKVRDRVKELLNESGAFRLSFALKDIDGEAWLRMAYIDRLVEIGEIQEVPIKGVSGQNRVFIEAI